jgi:hypothetical protein
MYFSYLDSAILEFIWLEVLYYGNAHALIEEHVEIYIEGWKP